MANNLINRAETMREMRRISRDAPSNWCGPDFWHGVTFKVAKIIVDLGKSIDPDHFVTLMSVGAGAYPPKPDPLHGDMMAYADERRAIERLRGALASALGKNAMGGGRLNPQEAGFGLKSLVGRATSDGEYVLTLRRKVVADTKKKDSATYFIERSLPR